MTPTIFLWIILVIGTVIFGYIAISGKNVSLFLTTLIVALGMGLILYLFSFYINGIGAEIAPKYRNGVVQVSTSHNPNEGIVYFQPKSVRHNDINGEPMEDLSPLYDEVRRNGKAIKYIDIPADGKLHRIPTPGTLEVGLKFNPGDTGKIKVFTFGKDAFGRIVKIKKPTIRDFQDLRQVYYSENSYIEVQLLDRTEGVQIECLYTIP